MKKVLVDLVFFKLGDQRSNGLVSGLKTLSQRNFEITVEQIEKIPAGTLRVLESENIELNESKGLSDYVISAKPADDGNVFFVGEESTIKNISAAVDSIIRKERSANVKRKTKETDIEIQLELDGEGKSKIKTGIGFFDHMLEQIARHANINLNVSVNGDLHIDEHHTVEDTGIALGEAIKKALGTKLGIKRFGYFLPMDDSIARCAIDLSGRSYLNFKCKFERETVGEFPTELTEEFFRGLSGGLAANVYLKAKGKNDHHKIEAMFKAFAKSLNEACRIDKRAKNSLPSTKGVI